MSNFELRIEYNHFGLLASRAPAVVGKIVKKTTLEVVAEAKKRAPIDTGNLVNSIEWEMPNETSGLVTVGAEYAVAVEYGTGIYGPNKKPFTIKARSRKALFWKGAKHPVKQVTIQGMKARPFLTPAVSRAERGFLLALSQLEKSLG